MTRPQRAPKPHSLFAMLAARALRATLIVDRASTWFDRIRSKLVVSCVSDAVLDAYNAIAYGASGNYDPASARFRADWFPWEAAAIGAFFPAAPSRVLVGGAGGGREALCLAAAGYDVTAFEPVRELVAALDGCTRDTGCRALVGRYETLPEVTSLDGTALSLRAGSRFDAGIMGWGSLAHVRRDADRLYAIRQFVGLVRGPVLLSVYPELWNPQHRRLERWLHAEGALFSPGLGRVETFDEARFRDLLSRAGVEVLSFDVSARIDNWPHAVVQDRREASLSYRPS